MSVSVKDFGATGDGVADDTAAIQAAIDHVSPFQWQGGTRATEMASQGGAVFFPRGLYRITAKIRLAPNLWLYGEGTGNDWTVRSGSVGTPTGGVNRLGSAILVDYAGNDYALDTSPYGDQGARLDNITLDGGDSFHGRRTEVHNLVIEDMTIQGRWSTRGLNLAGAVKSRLSNVLVRGFSVGVRWSAAWYSAMEDVRVLANYRGIVAYHSVTDLCLRNVSVARSFEAPVYLAAQAGRDSSDPPVRGDLTQPLIDQPCGIYSFYSNLDGSNVTVESFPVGFFSVNSTETHRGIYVEGIDDVVVRVQGSDQQFSSFDFDTIVSNRGDLLWSSMARVRVCASAHNYTQAGFTRLIQFLNTQGQRQFTPMFGRLSKNPADTTPDTAIRRTLEDHANGAWTPVLRFGGSSAGTQVGFGTWHRTGDLVTCLFTVQMPSKGTATGAATLEGLPFASVAEWGHYGVGQLGFVYAYHGSTELYVPNQSSQAVFRGVDQSHFLDGADLRGMIVYRAADRVI